MSQVGVFSNNTSGGATIDQFTANSGTNPVLPDASNNVNILGGVGITTVASLNTLTINATGDGFTWQDQGTSTTLVAENGYFASAAVTLTLPTSPVIGTTVVVYADTASPVVLQAATGQTIRLGNTASTVAGTLTNSSIGDSVTLTYRVTDTTWLARGVLGTWNTA